MIDLVLKKLVPEQIADIRLAASKMSGFQRREFTAEMSSKYCGANARLTEKIFCWSRTTVSTGLGEKRTGIVCIGSRSLSRKLSPLSRLPSRFFQLQNCLIFIFSGVIESDYSRTIPVPTGGCPTFRILCFGYFVNLLPFC